MLRVHRQSACPLCSIKTSIQISQLDATAAAGPAVRPMLGQVQNGDVLGSALALEYPQTRHILHGHPRINLKQSLIKHRWRKLVCKVVVQLKFPLQRGTKSSIWLKNETILMHLIYNTCEELKIIMNKTVRKNKVRLGDVVFVHQFLHIEYGKRVHILPFDSKNEHGSNLMAVRSCVLKIVIWIHSVACLTLCRILVSMEIQLGRDTQILVSF